MAGQSHGPEEPYTHHFMTTVERVDDDRVVLEETYFYPEGGGQPADRGSIDGLSVVDVQTVDGEVVHVLEGVPSFGAGDFVSGSVDEQFRQYCMRAHTASHALYGAGRRLFEDLGYGGFDISPEKVRVDLSTSGAIDDDALVELERLVNEVVWEDRSVSWSQVPREDALARGDVAYNAATEEGVTDDESIRLVEIDGWDVAACGGTHVSETSEIGPVTVLDRSNPGEGLTRVTFAVGPDAIDRRARDHESALAAARALDVSVRGLPRGVADLQNQYDALQTDHEQLRERYVRTQIDGIEVQRADGVTWLVGPVDGLDANGLAEWSQEYLGDGNVVVLVADDGSTLAAATDGSRDARDLVDRATDTFGGGGGGSETVAQAGGLDATAAEICELYP